MCTFRKKNTAANKHTKNYIYFSRIYIQVKAEHSNKRKNEIKIMKWGKYDKFTDYEKNKRGAREFEF